MTRPFTTRSAFTAAFVGFVVMGFVLGSVLSGEVDLLLRGIFRAAVFLTIARFLWTRLDRLRCGQPLIGERGRHVLATTSRWGARARRYLAEQLGRLVRR